MVKQEHAGELIDTNFAVVGRRSEADFDIDGDIGEQLVAPQILNREFVTDVHGLQFLAVPA